MTVDSRFVIGIDLGTSNSALAWVDMATAPLDDPLAAPRVETLQIAQVTAPGAVEARQTLPSVIYVRGEAELPAGALNLPWRADPGYCVGEFAREQGGRAPGRMIHSSKSWLCHDGVDREARILPPAGREEDARRSPVEAATMILDHLRAAWNHAMAQGWPGPGAPPDLAEQQVILCVPASFDAAARGLTMKAAEAAGLVHVQLLEEPQAAFHAWIADTGAEWRRRARVGDIALVVDVGGGTSDFSLIAVREAAGELELRRIAVGDHILLGGDNMDLALAYHVAEKLEKERGKKLDAQQFGALTQQCRVAKERLLSDSAAAAHPLVILGRGAGVVGGTIRAELRRDELERLLIEGFFPRCSLADRPARPRRSGFREAGLPYAADPAITLHLASFLGRQHEAFEELAPGGGAAGEDAPPRLPTAILFNGGVFRAEALRQRTLEVAGAWAREAGVEPPRVFEGANLDLAVARGAAYFGWARRGRGVRVRGGSPRAYYIGIESAAPAVPGMAAPLKAMCVVPYGMEEGERAEIPGAEADLCVWTGEPAVFRFLSSTTRRHDPPGRLLDVNGEEFVEHSPVETTLGPAASPGAKGEGGRPVEVDLRSHLTDIGTLELFCVERGSENAWKLEFSVRAENAAD